MKKKWVLKILDIFRTPRPLYNAHTNTEYAILRMDQLSEIYRKKNKKK